MSLRIIVGGIVALCCTGLPGPVHARELILSPTTKWWLDYAPDSCRMARVFGSGDEQVVASFTRYQPGDGFALILSGKPLGGVSRGTPVKLRFGDTGSYVETDPMIGTAGDKEHQVAALILNGRLDNLDMRSREWKTRRDQSPDSTLLQLAPITPEQEGAVSSLWLRAPGKTVSLALGSMGPPMAAMRKCTSDLVKEWGFDPDEQAALATPPIPVGSPGDWVRSSDYPIPSLMAGEQALIDFRLTIDALGRTVGCAIQSNISADPTFAKETCALISRRARFRPATNAAGKAIASYYVNRVRWIIP